MDPSQLKSGVAYFLATYPDPMLRKPVVITYEYIRTDTFEEDGTPAYIFKYLPAYRHEDEQEEGPFAISGRELEQLLDLEGLIQELQEVKTRAA